jgi:hypothetical protein
MNMNMYINMNMNMNMNTETEMDRDTDMDLETGHGRYLDVTSTRVFPLGTMPQTLQPQKVMSLKVAFK